MNFDYKPRHTHVSLDSVANLDRIVVKRVGMVGHFNLHKDQFGCFTTVGNCCPISTAKPIAFLVRHMPVNYLVLSGSFGSVPNVSG